MILCFQCEDLSKLLLVSKFETNWRNIKLIIILCHTALSCLKGLKLIHKIISISSYCGR